MKKEKQGEAMVYFCNSCKTDIRFKNVKYHMDCGHTVIEYLRDPRDEKGRKKNG